MHIAVAQEIHEYMYSSYAYTSKSYFCFRYNVVCKLWSLQEKSKMEMELEGLKRRLNKAERELVNSKEECIHLTTNTQALEREVHLLLF